MAFPLPQTDPDAGPTHSLGKTLRGSLLVILGLLLIIATIEVPIVGILVIAGGLVARRVRRVRRAARRNAKDGNEAERHRTPGTDHCIDG